MAKRVNRREAPVSVTRDESRETRHRRPPRAVVRTAAAIALGVLVAVLLGYLALLVFLLTTIGLPLGADPEPLTAVEYGVLLLLAGVAAAAGGRTATRVARRQGRVAAGGVGAILAITMVWGFSGRNAWPEWWGAAVASVMVSGSCAGGSCWPPRRRR